MTGDPRYLPAELSDKAIVEAEDEAYATPALRPEMTPELWDHILRGRPVRWLYTKEKVIWAGQHARSCGACKNTKMHGDPRRGWCTVHRFAVSLAFTVLCREFKS